MKRNQDPQKAVDHWNATVKVGDRVVFEEVIGVTEPEEHTTATEAQILGGHTAVVWLNGKSGCVCISHCKPAQTVDA